ncbi:hypothetical protein G7009_16175 [Pseudomonas capeferrum]|uniref:hypothetical protein n=1 Tax=Pseudomonas capeferrum TaxID=1495066 RepID=UPI0015E38E57|nr:hypothetical protein [Pseudomonas capeferrum]MBA1203269.1 hypothetical protein [Pseudomonas capeferrum]
MNSQRAMMWIGFLGLSAALAWAPGHWVGQPPADSVTTQGVKVPTRTVDQARSVPAVAPRAATRDLFPSQRWSAAPTLAKVTEQPVAVAPVIAAPAAPVLPFQFVGRLDDRLDQQVFLQDGEKLYVVRQGDVIEDTYRIEQISATELSLVYLPLHLSQTLSVGSAP